jgi:hypothetical protein
MSRQMESTTAHTPEHSAKSDLGVGLIGVLVSLVILAGLAAAVLASQAGSGGDHQAPSNQTSVDASPAKGAADVSSAAQATCRTDYAAAVEAASEFETLTGRQAATMAELGSLVKDSLMSSAFIITINLHVPGQLEVATPGHPAQPGNANCAYAR